MPRPASPSKVRVSAAPETVKALKMIFLLDHLIALDLYRLTDLHIFLFSGEIKSEKEKKQFCVIPSKSSAILPVIILNNNFNLRNFHVSDKYFAVGFFKTLFSGMLQ